MKIISTALLGTRVLLQILTHLRFAGEKEWYGGVFHTFEHPRKRRILSIMNETTNEKTLPESIISET